MKRIISLASFMAIIICVNAQEQGKHEKKDYVDASGKYYIQVEEPIFIYVSRKDDGKDFHKLNSETTPKYANPMYFKEDGKHYIRRHDFSKESQEREVVFEVYADGTAPVSAYKLESTTKYEVEGKVFYGAGLKIDIEAKDELSGIENSFISINGAAYQKYITAIPAVNEGEYKLKLYSVDNVGNAETEKLQNFFLDVSSPLTSLLYNGSVNASGVNPASSSNNEGGVKNAVGSNAVIVGPQGSFKLESEDNLAGVKHIKYSFEEGKESEYKKVEISIDNMEEGLHTLSFYAEDNVLNKEDQKKHAFYLDKTPPEVEENIIGDKFISGSNIYVSGNTTIELTATDNKAGVKEIYYSYGEAFLTYEGPLKLDQNVHLRYYAVDNVDNAGDTENDKKSIIFDKNPPKTSSSFVGNKKIARDTMFISNTTKVLIEFKDEISGIKSLDYSLNGMDNVPYTEPFSIDEDGLHKIVYNAVDQVNNVDKQEFFFVVDSKSPEVGFHFGTEPIGDKSLRGEKFNIYAKNSTLHVDGSDKGVGVDKIFYVINAGAEIEYTKPIKLADGGDYIVDFRVIDALGNVSKETIKFAVDG